MFLKKLSNIIKEGNMFSKKLANSIIIMAKSCLLSAALAFSFSAKAKMPGAAEEIKDKQWARQAFAAKNYDQVDNTFSETLIYVEKNGKAGLVEKETLREIISPQYEGMEYLTEDFIVFQKDGLQGLMSAEGREIAPPVYDRVRLYSKKRGLAAVEKYGKTAFMDRNGHVTELYNNYLADSFGSGLLWVQKGHLWGLVDIDEGFQEIIPPQYGKIDKDGGEAAKFGNAWTPVQRDGLWTFMDENFKEAFPPQYEWLEDLRCGKKHLSAAKKEGKEILFDNKALKELSPAYSAIHSWWGGYAGGFIGDSCSLFFVENDGLIGLINAAGREIVPPQYRHFEDFVFRISDNKIEVLNGGLKFLMDLEGNYLTRQYEEIYEFRNGFAAVKRDALWTFVDEAGQEIAQPQYEKASGFDNGFARVKRDGLWTFIDEAGQEIAPPKYEKASDFSSGFARVKRDGLWTFMDEAGREIAPPQYLAISHIEKHDGRVRAEARKNSLANKYADSSINYWLSRLSLVGRFAFKWEEWEYVYLEDMD